jgi:hypothetical protein
MPDSARPRGMLRRDFEQYCTPVRPDHQHDFARVTIGALDTDDSGTRRRPGRPPTVRSIGDSPCRWLAFNFTVRSLSNDLGRHVAAPQQAL